MFGKNSPQVASSSKRAKLPLGHGHSLMDWVRLGSQDLRGTTQKRVTLEELRMHCTPDDAWMCLRGRVYNITAYMKYHPGGVDELMRAAGADGTALFDQTHRWVNFESMLANCCIGPLVSNSSSSSLSNSSSSSSRRGQMLRAPVPSFGKPSVVYHTYRLAEATLCAPHTFLCRLEWEPESKDDAADTKRPGLGLQPGMHVQFKATLHDAERGRRSIVLRSYTPVCGSKGGRTLYFAIKTYESPKGLMSRHVCEALPKAMPPFVFVSEPQWANGFNPKTLSKIDHLTIFAAGTGITPFVSIVNAWLDDKLRRGGMAGDGEPFSIQLICCNRTREDILLLDDLEKLASCDSCQSACLTRFGSLLVGQDVLPPEAASGMPQETVPLRVDVAHALSQDSKVSTGRINLETVASMNICKGKNRTVMICGPPGFNGALVKILTQLEFEQHNIVVFA
jgi:cytochrome b involved in lipid metabolism/ferredoxin-NADP reductase